MDLHYFAAVSAVFVLAGLVKGLTGLGLPTVAVSLFAVSTKSASPAAWPYKSLTRLK